MARTITVGVAAHKPYEMPDDPCYLPIHVGRALHPEVVPQLGSRFVGDDTGDSISAKNATYCELTALWWLWRNCDSDFKGLVHYRRHLASPNPARRGSDNRLSRVATGEELLGLLSRCDAVLPRRRNYYIETMRSHWDHTQPPEQLAEAERVIAELEPGYSAALSTVLSSRGAHMFNMMVMRADLFDAYCAWLFPLLDELVNRLDPASYPPFQARYPGRVSELLLDAWLDVNGVSYVELPTVSPEPVDWAAKGKGFLAAKFLGKKYEKSF